MAGDDELLRGLGVTARGERELARDVIRDAAAAAAAREDARRGGDPGRVDGHVDAVSIGGDGGGAGAAERGPGDGPAARTLARLRDESERLERELAAVRDALDEVRRRTLDGDAPVDAALQIAVGERRVQGLADKRDALDANLREAEENAVAEASERARASPGAPKSPTPGIDTNTSGKSDQPTETAGRRRARRAPAAVVVREDDDFDALMDTLEGRTAGNGNSARGDIGETERERLIRTGVITPFDALAGFERRTNDANAAADAHVASMSAWKAGRGATKLLEGDAVPKQRPEAREFGRRPRRHAAPGLDAKVAAKRREWRRAAAEREGGGAGGSRGTNKSGGKTRRRRRQRDAAYSSDEEDSDEGDSETAEEEEGAEEEEEEDGDGDFIVPKVDPESAPRSLPRWPCPACTFANPGERDACELCETPRPQVTRPGPADDDDDVQFVREIAVTSNRRRRRRPAPVSAADPQPPAPKRGRGPRVKTEPSSLGDDARRPSAAPPPTRRAARVAARNAGRAAAAEADGEAFGDGSESEYADDDDDADADDDDDDEVEEEEETEGDEDAGGEGEGEEPPARAPRSRRAPRRHPRQPAEEDDDDDDEEEEEEDIIFDGGLRIPSGTYARLLEHQRTSIKWLWELHCQRAGGIIGDEMGLGKTVQVSAFLCALERSGLYRPTLVVCPATMLRQWRRELRAWAPALRPVILHESAVSQSALADARGNKKSARLKLLRDCVADAKGVLLTTYEHLRLMRDHVLSVRWGYAVLDEGHKIRNPDADVTICAKQLQTVHRLIMTGAPIQNRLSELWSLFDFCFPGKLGTLPVFQAQFAVPIQLGGYSNASQQQVVTAYRCATMLKDLISPYLLRRMKADVNINLPKKTEQVLFCPMTGEQREAYRSYIHSRDVEEILEGRREALGGIDVLRKIVNHPDLLERTTQAHSEKYGEAERSGKLLVTEKVLGLWREQGHRCLLFSQTQQMLDILEAAIARAGYTYRRMDGTTPVSHRMRLIDEFNGDDDVFVFLLTTKVGGLGVNLTGADRVLLYDPDWNPSTDAQARERAWRIGQTKEVTVYRLITAGTIEEKVYHRQIYKEFLTSKVLKDPKQRRFFKAKDLADLFTWEEDNANTKPGKEDAIETAELFTEVEAEIRAADVAGSESDADDFRSDAAGEDGKVGTEKSAPEAGGWGAGDPDLVPNGVAPGGSVPGGPSRFRMERDRLVGSNNRDGGGGSGAAARDGGDAAIMRSLFGGGGDGGSGAAGTIRGAMNHDAIMGAAGGGRDHVTSGHHARVAAERTARAAAEAVRASSRGRANVAVPTWTGRSGAAGAPPGSGGGRFGRAPLGGGGGGGGGAGGAGIGAGIVGASRGGMGSQTLLQRIRERDAAAGTVTAMARGVSPGTDGDGGSVTDDESDGDAGGGATRADAEKILDDICGFLRDRPGGAAPTGLIVDAFGHAVRDKGLFRRLLKQAARLEKGAGTAQWVLRDHFA